MKAHNIAPKVEKGKNPRRRVTEIAVGLTAAASTLVGCSVGNEAAPAPTVTVTASAEAKPGAKSLDTITDEQRRIAADIALENLGTLLEKFGGESSQFYDSEKNELSVNAMYNDDLMLQDTLPGTETFENGDMRRNYSYAYVTTKRTVDGTWETSINTNDLYPIFTKSGELLDDKDISAEEGLYQSSESYDTVVVTSSAEPNLQSVQALVDSLKGNGVVSRSFIHQKHSGDTILDETPNNLQQAVDEIADF